MMTYQQIDDKILLTAKKFQASEAELLEIISLVDKSRTWKKLCYTSLFDYCVRRLKLSESTTSAFISVSRSEPKLKEAVLEGTLNLSQAKRIVSVVEPATVQKWVEKASTLKQRDLEREVKATLPSPPPTERIKPVGGDMSELKLVIPEAMRKKLERLQEVRGCSILEAFDFAMDETLKRHDPLEKAKRSSRNVRLRVQSRDNSQCTFQHPDGTRCQNRRWIDHHHLIHRANGGRDTVDNITLLCRQHHRQVHRAQRPITFHALQTGPVPPVTTRTCSGAKLTISASKQSTSPTKIGFP